MRSKRKFCHYGVGTRYKVSAKSALRCGPSEFFCSPRVLTLLWFKSSGFSTQFFEVWRFSCLALKFHFWAIQYLRGSMYWKLWAFVSDHKLTLSKSQILVTGDRCGNLVAEWLCFRCSIVLLLPRSRYCHKFVLASKMHAVVVEIVSGKEKEGWTMLDRAPAWSCDLHSSGQITGDVTQLHTQR